MVLGDGKYLKVYLNDKRLYDALVARGRVATQGIYFDTGSDRLRPESSGTLNEIGRMLKDHADLKLTIEGRTDNVGGADSKQVLSEKRAAAVRHVSIDAVIVQPDDLLHRQISVPRDPDASEIVRSHAVIV
jgi:outer membrane protein OmpA-like peptidoglycan-associated protein